MEAFKGHWAGYVMTYLHMHISTTEAVTLICFYLILRKKHMVEAFKGHWAGPNECHLLSQLRSP